MESSDAEESDEYIDKKFNKDFANSKKDFKSKKQRVEKSILNRINYSLLSHAEMI